MPDIRPEDIPHPKLDKADPDVGVDVTVDSSGHVRQVDIDARVPGTTGGSDPGHYQVGGHDPASPEHQPGWTPTPEDPNPEHYNPLPVPTGWHRDPNTGFDLPGPADAYQPTSDSESHSEPGDYELPSGDESTA